VDPGGTTERRRRAASVGRPLRYAGSCGPTYSAAAELAASDESQASVAVATLRGQPQSNTGRSRVRDRPNSDDPPESSRRYNTVAPTRTRRPPRYNSQATTDASWTVDILVTPNYSILLLNVFITK